MAGEIASTAIWNASMGIVCGALKTKRKTNSVRMVLISYTVSRGDSANWSGSGF
jgi:hypothetical protein